MRRGRIVAVAALLAAACASLGDPATSNGLPGGEAFADDGGAGDGAIGGGDWGGDAGADVVPRPVLAECATGPAPSLPATSPRILLLAPQSLSADRIAMHLQGFLDGDATFDAPEVVTQETDAPSAFTSVSLAGYWYTPEYRDARIAPLAGPFSWVVMLDDPTVALYAPELHFEGARVVGCRARAAGARTLLLQSWRSDTSDTDMRGEIAYRVGNGTGSAVVPAGWAWLAAQADAGAPDADAGPADAGNTQNPIQGPSEAEYFLAAADVYTAITGRSAASTTYQAVDVPLADQPHLEAIAHDTVVAHESMTHYTKPFDSAVKLATLVGASGAPGATLRFMTSGTSSEALWTDRMNEIVPRFGLVPQGTAIGTCNDYKIVDDTCKATAAAAFGKDQYGILFARGYAVTAADIASAGGQTDLQVQVWDRHFDQDPADGAMAVDALEIRSQTMSMQARGLGLAWIPYHLAFAKLKTARPAVQLTSDGTHATYPVSYTLAAMSMISRTSMPVPTSGLDDDTSAGVIFGYETIYQLAALSQTGEFVPDDPAKRPKAR